MKTILAAGLTAALVALPVSGAFAEEIKPLTATQSTQTGGDSMVGGFGPAGLVAGGLALLTIITIMSNDNKSTGTTK